MNSLAPVSKRKRKCKSCGNKFVPQFNTLQPTCGEIQCAIDHGKKTKAQQVERERKASKRKLYEEDLRWWISIDKDRERCGGNTAFWVHKYVRLVRDAHKPCIMCGAFEPKGGKWDACHYRSRGAASQLRFHLLNIHKGCTWCNTHTTSETGIKYRANLVERIGEEDTLWLDNNNDEAEWTIEICRSIRDEHKALCKAAGV